MLKKKEEKKKRKKAPMASVVINGMGDVGAVVIVGVVMAHIVSKLVKI